MTPGAPRLVRRAAHSNHAKSRTDRGYSLVELVVSITVSGALIAVIVAAIITSLNLATTTSDVLKSSVDIRLISTFLERDAQSAGGTDPLTAAKSTDAGLSTAAGDWGGCAQSGAALVVRFSWIDRIDLRTKRKIVSTWAFKNGVLTRQYCEDGVAKSSLTLGRALTSASASCDYACSASPSTVTISVVGSNNGTPFSTSLSASLRPDTQDTPTESNSSAVPLLALGDGTGAACPNLTVSDSATANVIGDAIIGGECSTPLVKAGTSTLNVLGATMPLTSLTDPFVSRVNPCATLPTARTYTDADGIIQPGTYAAQVTMTKNIVFAPGVYCFTSTSTPALTLGATSRISGKGVTIYLASGGFTVSAGATVNLSAPTTGSNANMLVWLPKTNTRAVSINSGSLINTLSGYVYAPGSSVTVTGAAATKPTAIGGVVSKAATVSSFVISRFGRIPDISITPSSLPNGSAGSEYSQALSVSNLGSGVTWSQTGLTSGLSLDPAVGTISGTPSCWGSSSVIVSASDSTGLGTWASLPLSITPGITLEDPGDEVFDYAYLNADAPPACGGATATITFQYSPTGKNTWATIPGCSAVASPFVCTWDTLALDAGGNPVFTNKSKYDVRAVIDSTSYYSATYTTLINNIYGGDVQTTPSTPNPGKLDSGDIIEFTFTDEIKPSRLIKGWDGSARSIFFRISAGDIFKSAVPASFAKCQRNSCGVFFSANPNDCTSVPTDADRVWDAPTVNLGVLQAASGNTFPNGGQSMWLMNASMRLEPDNKTVTITLGSTVCSYWSKAGAGTSSAYAMVWYPLINHASTFLTESGTLDIDF